MRPKPLLTSKSNRNFFQDHGDNRQRALVEVSDGAKCSDRQTVWIFPTS